MGLTLVGNGWRAFKCELAAAYAGVPLTIAPFTTGITNETPTFLQWSPDGKVCVYFACDLSASRQVACKSKTTPNAR